MIVCSADLSGSVRCCLRDGSLPLDNSCSSASNRYAPRTGSALAQSDVWGPKLEHAVEEELALSRRQNPTTLSI